MFVSTRQEDLEMPGPMTGRVRRDDDDINNDNRGVCVCVSGLRLKGEEL